MAKKGSTVKPPVAPVSIPTIAQVAQGQANLPSLPGKEIKPSIASIQWDTETKADLGQKILSIRDVHGFPNAPLSYRMEAAWGLFTGIRTATVKPASTITIGPADPLTDPNAVPVNRSGAQNLVNFSLIVPLSKLGVRPTSDRQWDIIAQEVELADAPPVFVFNVVERKSVPRHREDGEEETEDAKPKASAKAAKASGKKSGGTKDSLLDDDMELFDDDDLESEEE